jgi:hypothetical protein
LETFELDIRMLMMEYLKDWEAIGLALKGLVGCDQEFHIWLGQHAHKWSACRCFSLYNNFQALRAGSDKFLVVYVDRWS